jgi:thiol-disulfide isomerase/thioredoxin
MITQKNALMTAMLFVMLVMTAVVSTPVGASEVKTMSRQDLNAMIEANAGAITLVSYWATWCSACREEIPALNDVHARYPRDQVRVIGVSFDKDSKKLDAFLKLAGIEYEVYRVPEKHRYGFKEIVALPTLVFYKKNGKKGWTNTGLMLSEQIRRTIDVFVEQN